MAGALRREGILESHFRGAFGADTAYNRLGHGQLASTAAAFAFMVDFDLISGGVVNVTPEPSEATGRGGIDRDFGFLGTGEAEFAVGDHAKILVIRPIIGASEDGDKVHSAIF